MYTFAYAWNQCGQRIHSNLSLPRPQLGCNIAVELGETFQITFRVARREAGGMGGCRTDRGATTTEGHGRLTEAGEDELVRVLLAPGEGSLLTMDADGKAVLVARRDLACPECAAGGAEAQQQLRIVVEPAAGDEVREVGSELGAFMPGDEFGEVEGVGADVAERPAGAALAGSPRQSACFCRWSRSVGQPVLCVLGLDDADGAEFAGLDHLAGLPDHRIAGVVVGQAKSRPERCTELDEVAASRQRGGQGLVADHRDPGGEEGAGGGVVDVVGGDDGDRVNPVGAGGFVCAIAVK